LTLSKTYRQDQALQWGFLTVPEVSPIGRRKAGVAREPEEPNRRPDQDGGIEIREFADSRGREVVAVLRPFAMEHLHPLLEGFPFGVGQVGVPQCGHSSAGCSVRAIRYGRNRTRSVACGHMRL